MDVGAHHHIEIVIFFLELQLYCALCFLLCLLVCCVNLVRLVSYHE